MDVNAKEIRTLRTNRGWTQQHLADASGVSLRTVQRVERYGVSSNETLLSFCAVFEVSSQTLIRDMETRVIHLDDVNKNPSFIRSSFKLLGSFAFGAMTTYIAMIINQ